MKVGMMSAEQAYTLLTEVQEGVPGLLLTNLLPNIAKVIIACKSREDMPEELVIPRGQQVTLHNISGQVQIGYWLLRLTSEEGASVNLGLHGDQPDLSLDHYTKDKITRELARSILDFINNRQWRFEEEDRRFLEERLLPPNAAPLEVPADP